MPKNEKLDEEEIKKLKGNAGVSKNTLKAKRRAEEHFRGYVLSNLDKNVEELCTEENLKHLESVLINYFSSYRLETDELPSMSTVRATRSHIKMMVKKLSSGKIDICDSAVFTEFENVMKGLAKKLKEAGKLDVKHHELIPEKSLEKVYHLLGVLSNLFELDENDPTYEENLSQIPDEFQDSYHYLAQYGAIYVINTQLVRRGNEGIDKLKTDHFELLEDENTGQQYYKKVLGEVSKNHQSDSEDLRQGGVILFEENSYGFNPGLFFHLFLSKLDKKAPFLFMRPIRSKKSFNLRQNPDVWYEAVQKIGVNQVQKALPSLTSAACTKRATNCQIRPTAITLMKDAGIEDRKIMSFSGHKSIQTLNNYNRGPCVSQQLNMG